MYRFAEDIELACELLQMSRRELATELGVSAPSIERWVSGKVQPSDANMELFYSYAYKKGLRFNDIKAQLYEEDYAPKGMDLLFHGSKAGITGALSLDKSRDNNDFGRGFYCGESLRQSTMFVARYPRSCVYMAMFDSSGLASLRFKVDEQWMLAVAYHRGRLKAYEKHPLLQEIINDVSRADYIVAPIADNRMFETIDSFIDGEITTEQCRHCLSATNLGNQYVFKTQKALERVELVEQCYVCGLERDDYLRQQLGDARLGSDKVKAARRQYRGQGKYIEELFE